MPELTVNDITADQREALDKMMARWPNSRLERVWTTEKNLYVSISVPNFVRPSNRHLAKYYWLNTKQQLRRSFWKRVG